MKIITRYILKEHIGPFVFALSALTSLLLLQYIARKFGDLVGRGLPWDVITEFMLLSVPFTVAMTLPMAVLVAVLHAFSRMASENEITALKAGGISTRALMRPALVWSFFIALFMLWFNDQVLSSANHQLATLQMAILRTKPTFALKEQVINTIKEGQLYLRAGYIDREKSGQLRDVTIYDVTDATRRRTIYAEHGMLQLAANKRDLVMHLYNGMMISIPTNQPGQVNRIYYSENELKVRDVANSFQNINADTSSKGEREMSVCEMQREYEVANAAVQHTYAESLAVVWRLSEARGEKRPRPKEAKITKAGGIGAFYCDKITKNAEKYYKKLFGVKAAQAAVVGAYRRQDTTAKPDTSKKQDTVKKQDTTKKAQAAGKGDSVMVLIGTILKKVPRDKVPPGAYIPETTHAVVDTSRRPVPVAQPSSNVPAVNVPPPPVVNPNVVPPPAAAANAAVDTSASVPPEIFDAKIRLDEARHHRNRYGVEIQKKFSLAAACIVFVLVGAPIALRFPRGGVGLVIGVSFAVFGIYYVGLIGGESLANKNYVSPFWAMWLDNVIFALVGLVLMTRMGHEGVTNRGGNLGEMMDSTRGWFARQGRRVGIGRRREATVNA